MDTELESIGAERILLTLERKASKSVNRVELGFFGL